MCKLTDGEHQLLRSMERGGWMGFIHADNITALSLHRRALLNRRPLSRPIGGYEYQINDAGRAALASLKGGE
jgi:hypothetical protein